MFFHILDVKTYLAYSIFFRVIMAYYFIKKNPFLCVPIKKKNKNEKNNAKIMKKLGHRNRSLNSRI